MFFFSPIFTHLATYLSAGFDPNAAAGLGELPNYFPNGGNILSVHQPTTSLAWLEENYDHRIVKAIRHSGVFSGPLAVMLFPGQPALAIFGPRNNDPKFAGLAQKLANKSGSPVITRLSRDDPMIRCVFKFSLTKYSESFPRSKALISVNDLGTSKNQLPAKVFALDPVVVMMAGQATTDWDGVGPNVNIVAEDVRCEERLGRGVTSRDPIRDVSDGGGPQNDGGNNSPGGIGHSSEGTGMVVSKEDTARTIENANSDGGGDPGDGGNGPGKANDNWEDWNSPWHTTKINVNGVRANIDCPVFLKICSETQVYYLSFRYIPSADYWSSL